MPLDSRTILALVPVDAARSVAGCPLEGLQKWLFSEDSTVHGGAPTAWIVPHQRAMEGAQAAVTRLSEGPRLSPGIRTLRQTADAILAAGPEVARLLTGVQQQQLVAEVLAADKSERRRHFGRVGNRLRLSEMLGRAFSELALSGLDASDHQSSPSQGGAVMRELVQLHRQYLTMLQRHQLLDAEGRLVAATKLIESGRLGPLAGVGRLLVSGYREFNKLERLFLAALASRLEQTTVVLPWSSKLEGAGGGELPKKHPHGSPPSPTPWLTIGKTALALAEDLPEVSWESSPEGSLSPRSYEASRLRDWLFRDPRQAPERDHAGDNQTSERYHVLPAAGDQAEFERVAAQVKQLLLKGVKAEEVVLATRRVDSAAILAERAFGEAGVPLAIDRPCRLSDAPLFRTLVHLLRLATADWKREDLLSVVTAPSLTKFDHFSEPSGSDDSAAEEEAIAVSFKDIRAAGFAGPRAATEWILREVMLAGGQAAWLDQLEANLAKSDGRPLSSRRRRLAVASAVARRSLERVSEQLRAWQSTATPLAWFDRLRGALGALGYRAVPTASHGSQEPRNLGAVQAAERDAAGLAALEESFAALERLARWREKPAPELKLEDVSDLLTAWASSVRIDPPRVDEGRVRLLPAEGARLLRPRHLFLVGMSEQSFPAAPRASLVEGHGATQEEHFSDEMLLFAELCQSASETVTFSFATLDAKGQPLPPSSYVAEVERLLDRANLRQPVSATAAETPAISQEAMQRQAVRSLNAGDKAGFAKWFPKGESSAPLLAGLRVSLDRASGDTFGPNEGVLPGEAARAWLAGHYNSEHLWSPTRLETYAQCPFKFYMGQVLGIEPIEEFDLSIDYRRRGSLVHNAMLRMHQRMQDAGDVLGVLSEIPTEEFIEAFGESVIAALESLKRPPQEAVLAEIEAMQATGWAGAYREQLGKYGNNDDSLRGRMRPAHYEVRFGPPRHGDTEEEESMAPPSRVEPFLFEIEGETLRLTGQVDRIDLGEIGEQTVFNIVDYKTASSVQAKSSELRNGRQLQLYLYMLATQHHLLADLDAKPWRLGYWAMRDGGFKQPSENRRPLKPSETSDAGVTPTDDWEAYGVAVKQRLTEIVHSIRGGEFPMFNLDEHCGARCEFRTTCRVGQTRSLEKLPPSDPALHEIKPIENDAEKKP